MNYDLSYRIPLVIPKISPEQFYSLTAEKQKQYLKLYREQVAPTFESFRKPARIKGRFGGRGAGGKSESVASLLIQIAEYKLYFESNSKILCLRKVQNTIKDSSKSLLERKIRELGFSDFVVTNEYIKNTNTGIEFIFKGLNDYNADNMKSLDSVSICVLEEASSFDTHSLDLLEPSIRKTWIFEGKEYQSEIWFIANLETRNDPFFERWCKNKKDEWNVKEVKPFGYDNPYYPQILIDSYLNMKARDEEEANHQFLGIPRSNQEHCVWSYEDVENAKDRILEDESGAIEIGLDIARSKNGDYSVAVKRKGLKVLEIRKVQGYTTQDVAGMVEDLADFDKSIPIKADQGGNYGVIDLLNENGFNVIPIAFGGKARNPDVYANNASEMMFTLPLKEMSIPFEFVTQELIEDLCERKYFYNAKGLKQLEPKDDRNGTAKTCFKNRHNGRSPDTGDALCLCFYEIYNDTVY